MDGSGYGFAEIEDVASAMMHLVTNPEINGELCSLVISIYELAQMV
jgi:hypothetical protein